ncbi:MAG: ABC transporter ATP-binding protein [candidate division SR1 bacterium]|nr:ABC transporter ATP-binding protein [candidate division SR1 bacterium]
MKTLKRLLQPIKRLPVRYFFFILTSAWFGILWPVLALLVSKAIKGIEMKDYLFFKTYLFIFLGLTIFSYITNYFIRTSRKVTVRLFAQNLYTHYVGKYLKSDNNKIEGLGTGQSNSIIQRGIESRRSIVNDTLLGGGARMLANLVMIFGIITINSGRKTLLIVITVFVIMIIFARFGNGRLRKIRRDRRELSIQYDRSLVRMIMSKFEILQNSKIIKELARIGDIFSRIIILDRKESMGYILASDMPRALLDLTKFGLIFWFGMQIFAGHSSFAEFTLIRMLMNQITGVLFEANDMMLNYYDQITYVHKIRDTFDEMPKLQGYEEGKTFKYKSGDIHLEKSSFSYGNKNVFQNFSLKIIGGKKTAFVGESGSGKTTLLKLISGYVHPDSGYIIVDGQKLSEVALKSYYENIGYLTQEPNVFDGSVIDNLLYGTKKKPTKKQIDSAITSAKCEFIYTFKEGLETQIGEKGVRLSGGQKQRLAIAKLFLKDPKIVFLDEPTSSLDSFSEEDIAHAFNNLFKGRTVIVVAHRLQTVKQADIIHVLNKGGKIVESGTHQELLKKKGIYYKMIELQSGF